MPLYNVDVMVKTTVVVSADDAESADSYARIRHRRLVEEDMSPDVQVQVTGEVNGPKDLRRGWSMTDISYCADWSDDLRTIEDHLKKEAT